VGRHSIDQRLQIAVRRQLRPRQRSKYVLAMNETGPVVFPLCRQRISLLGSGILQALLFLLRKLLVTLELDA
jgi:hypothetical protein